MEKSNYYNGKLDILSKSSPIRIDLSSFVKVETESGTKTCPQSCFYAVELSFYNMTIWFGNSMIFEYLPSSRFYCNVF